ncbi:MAG TPA: ABC transporter substrate-binding protein [Stellaceae bacterium]|nr:ABC transporter substrate-binding protein [Stellaceae bacterium]
MMRRCVLAAFLLLTATTAAAAPTAAAERDPAAFVRELGRQALDVLSHKASRSVRQARFRELFQANFDEPVIARFVLGRYWRVATPTEQRQFQKLFEDYVVIAYAARLSNYGGEVFKVIGDQRDGNGFVVASEIARPNGDPPLRIDWRLVSDNGALKIADVVVEGVSMAVTQRSEFASVIARNGGSVGGLLTLMREKTESAQR